MKNKFLKIYFGKQIESIFGGSTADVLKIKLTDDIDIEDLRKGIMGNKWFTVLIENGNKHINTENILWFDIVEEEIKNEQQ